MSRFHRRRRPAWSPTPEAEGPDQLDVPARSRSRSAYKTRQLCRQVRQTLELVLSDGEDLPLECLYVLAVTPAPDASRLLVTVGVEPPADAPLDLVAVQAAVQRQQSRLRCEVARAIHRRKTPALSFQIVPLPAWRDGRADDA